MQQGELKANATKSVLEVPIGIIMGGYSERKHKSQGVHDHLYTKCLALSNGKETLVIITNDLLNVDSELTTFVRKGIHQAFAINDSNILITASHTHSGPDLSMGTSNPDLSDQEKLRNLKKNLAHVILANALSTLENLKPAVMGYGKSSCASVGRNRTNPDLPQDSNVQVLHLKNKDDFTSIASLVNYTCHPTILNEENYLYSAEYPGILQKHLEEQGYGVVLFTNGAAGNQSTRFTRRSASFSEVERMGGRVAQGAVKAIQTIPSYENTLVLKAVSEPLPLPIRELPKKEDAIQMLQEAEELKNQAMMENQSEADIRLAITKWQGTQITLKMLENKKIRNLAEIQLLKIGSILLVGVPIELFVEYGLEIKEKTLHPNCAIVGYSNDYLGYVYHDSAVYEGLYEALASPFSAHTGKYIVNKVLELEKSL